MNAIIKKAFHHKKGFTLVEVIVVLVILAILIALAVPSVMKYIDDANDVKDDIKISYLNKATEGYRVRMYGDGKWQKGTDLFAGVNSSKDKQKVLLDAKWIDEYQTSIYDDSDYFTWDVAKQKWTRKAGSGGSGDKTDEQIRDDATILGDKDKGTNQGEWAKNTSYKYGDIVEVNGVFYKCTFTPKGTSIVSTAGPVNNFGRESYWKEIELSFDKSNNYETGDIIKFDGAYYKATGFDSSTNYLAYYNASSLMHYDTQIIRELFTKVEWKNGAFVEVKQV